MMYLEGQLQHERKKQATDLAERDALINEIQRKFEAQEKMIELMQRQCEKESRLRSLMTYRQARPDPHHVAAHTKDDDTRRISRQDRTRSSIRSSRRARSASITRSTVKLSDNPSTTQNAIVITRERREKRNFKNDLQKDVSDDSALSPDITDSDTSIKQKTDKSKGDASSKQMRKRGGNLSSRKLLEIGITI